jgi:hypothetical protein
MLLVKKICALILTLFTIVSASATQPDSRDSIIVTFSDAKNLATKSGSCKPPAPFAITLREMPPFDRRNWYRFIDLDGDGTCEVQYETCNSSSTIGRLQECYPWNWLYAVKWNGKEWAKPMKEGGSTTAIYRGATVMLYFNAATGRVQFKFELPYYEMPRVEWTYYPSAIKENFLKGGEHAPLKLNYEFDDGPFQHNGALIPLLDVHIRRILAEVKWRTVNCGGKNGYLDEDTHTATLDDLEGMVSVFLPRTGNPPPTSISPELIRVANRWLSESEIVFQAIRSRSPTRTCNYGYREIVSGRR